MDEMQPFYLLEMLLAYIYTVLLLTNPAHGQVDIRQRVTDIDPIALQQGVNVLSDLNHDGRTGQIILAWRDNGNAHGYEVFLVMLPTQAGREDWNIVRGPRGDLIRDYPHFGEDAVRSIRFVRAILDGHSATLLITATREIVATYPDPAKTTIEIFDIADGSNEVGTTWNYFRKIGSFMTSRSYCNAEMALQTELGIPVRSNYAGANSETGCL